MDKILIIEDDKSIAKIEKDYLEINDFEVKIVPDGISGVKEALSNDYNLILLDIMLPGMDGFEVCKRIREKLDVPILMLTARIEDADKIRGLGLGADDYIEKPFSPSELIARIKANIRQYKRIKTTGGVIGGEIRIGDITINTLSHKVLVKGEEKQLKNKEYELLLFFVMNPDIIFSKDQLYEKIWGFDAIGDTATVAVHVNRIREKIEITPELPKYIHTVWGVGYKFKV